MKFLKYIFKPLIGFIVPILAWLLENIYGQNYSKFFVLETIARIPYFSYLSVLHLYQSLGQHPTLELMDLHYKETVNEEYHLLIMEDLGGGKHWYNRFVARFIGVIYYWAVVILYILNPESGYYLMELVETHAAKSYTEFLGKNEARLKDTLAEGQAKKYFFSVKGRMTKPGGNKEYEPNLYEVFTSIRNDELIHVSDMKLCGKMASLYSQNQGIEIVDEINRRGI